MPVQPVPRPACNETTDLEFADAPLVSLPNEGTANDALPTVFTPQNHGTQPRSSNGRGPAATDLSALPVTLVPITCLYSEDATRMGRNAAHVDHLEADFRRWLRDYPNQHPVQTPLRVLPRGNRYLIVAGNYRYLAALRIPLASMPCQILPYDLNGIHLFIEMHRDNALHEDYRPVELARNILHVKEQLRCSQAEAGRLLGIASASETAKLLSVLKLPQDVLELIGEGDGKVPFTSAYPLSRLRDEAKIRELADKALRGLLCRDKLVDAVDAILHGSQCHKKPKPLKLNHEGVQLTVCNPTIDSVQAFAKRVLSAIAKLVKDGDGIEFLSARLKTVTG